MNAAIAQYNFYTFQVMLRDIFKLFKNNAPYKITNEKYLNNELFCIESYR